MFHIVLDMCHSGKMLLGGLVLLLALHGSVGEPESCPHLLEPTGDNVCLNGPKDPELKRLFGKSECCPGWIQSGRKCSIRHPCPHGIRNCTDFPTGLIPNPTVSYGNNSAASNLEMVCSLDFPDWKNVSYKVEWFSKSAKSEAIKTETWCIPDQPETPQNDCRRRRSSIYLPEDFRLDDTVWCKVFMKFSTNKTNIWTKTGKESNKYYVGIEVSRKKVNVKECNVGKNITVTIRPTVPILPDVNVAGSDSVDVSVLIPQKYKTQRRQAAVDKCHLKLRTKDIALGQSITIRGVCDNQLDQRQTYSFHFIPETSSPSWQGVEAYRMPSLKVTVDNTDTTLCYSTSDPNFFTFDDRDYFYNELGDYIMYSNNARKIQVHIRLWNCFGDVTCICGAAIREGRHVLEISFCNRQENAAPSILRTVKRSPGKLSRGIEVKKQLNGGSLDQEVILSSGTRISVHRSGRSLDVRVNAPATDKGQVTGLCGNFNGDPKDDLRQRDSGKVTKNVKDFLKSWRITNKESYFDILPEQEVDEESDEERSCYCGIEGEENQEEYCDYNSNIFTSIDATRIEVLTSQLNDPSQFGLKRSATPWYSDDVIDHVERSYSVDDPQVQQAMNRIRSKRSLKTVMSQRGAIKYCNRYIKKSKGGNTCKGISNASIKNAIKQCVNDLRFTGDKSFAVLAFDTMKYVCEDTALKNLSSYTHTRSGDLVPRKEVAKELCPSDCSGHGKCANRTCICDKGFTALDCSMEVQAVPELLGIYNGGLCDVRERPCKKTNLLGQKFIDSSNLTCHVKEFKVFPSSWSPRGVPVTKHGKMIDIFGVKCDLPEPPTKLGDYDHEGTPAAGVLVSVSNDGFRTSSQELRQITYDSKCMTCNKAGRCQRTPNSCLIRGHCFAANEPNPRDWCQQCLPRDDQNAWTPRKNNQAPRFGRKPITYNALRGEDLVLQLRATDPDNRPVMYSVLSSTASGYTLTRAGVLRGKVTSNEKFSFKVTDECGAFDTTDMRLRIVRCQCLNGGQCVPHPYYPRGSGRYQCRCVNGFSGARCEKTGPQPTRPAKPTTPAKPTPKPTTPAKPTSKPTTPAKPTPKPTTPAKPRPTIRPKPGGKVPSAAPVITSITPVRYDAMVVWWSPVPVRQPSSFIKGYKIYYREMYTQNKWNVFTTFTGFKATATVTGLQPYTEYCVKMSAFNNKGEYPYWNRKQCFPVKTPSLPIRVSGQAVSRTAIRLRFQKPRRGPPSRRVQVEYGKQKDRLNMKSACSAATCTIDNLEPDTMYYFKVIGYVYQRGETPSFAEIRTLA